MAELSDAIVAIINGADNDVQYTFSGTEILSWESETVTQPTPEELQAKLEELND